MDYVLYWYRFGCYSVILYLVKLASQWTMANWKMKHKALHKEPPMLPYIIPSMDFIEVA